MATCVLSVEDPETIAQERPTMAITGKTPQPAADGDELRTSGRVRPRITREAAAVDGPVRPASLAEFAHDLCSPLGALDILARGLRESESSPDRSADLDAIVRISEQVLGMVRDVLDRAAVEAGSDVPRIATCDLQELVRDVIDITRPRAEAKSLDLLISRDGACPRYVRTDAFWLERILINVLDNAVKYTAQGSVSLSVDFAESRDSERTWLVFEIRDTGIGIARKDQARIFERFVRVPGVSGTTGNGLGLTSAIHMVHSMGGMIRVNSKPGAGSSFRIELPVTRAQEADGALPPTPERPPLPLEDLAALPYELRAELRASLVALNGARIHTAIERITQHNAPLGAILKSHANLYAFTGIFEAVSLGL